MPAEIADGEAIASEAPPPTTMRLAPTMSWFRAIAIGFGVFLYFAVFTVVVPSSLLKSDAVASASQSVQNLVVTGTWSVALIAGLVGLRVAQRRGWI